MLKELKSSENSKLSYSFNSFNYMEHDCGIHQDISHNPFTCSVDYPEHALY